MKTLVNITPGQWADEILAAIHYVYVDHPDTPYPRLGCDLVLERVGVDPILITGLGKADFTNFYESVRVDTNLSITHRVVGGGDFDYTNTKILPDDLIYLITP